MSNIKVSINILNYNTFEKSRICIDSCLKQKGIDYVVILIDNHSSDDSFQKLKEFYGDRINYLENKENYGFAKGNNIGVDYCKNQGYRYTLLLNSDTELIGNNLVKKMVEVMESNNDCAVVAPTIFDVTSKGRFMHPNDSFYLKLLRYGKVIPKNIVISDELETMSEAHGSALLVDNDAFLKVGGFPEHYFMYGEEGCFAKKILWEGKRIYWWKNSEQYILHHHDKSGYVEPWRLYLKGRNLGLEYWEHKKGHYLWSLIFGLFQCSLYLRKKNRNEFYIKGLRDAKTMYKDGVSNDEIYKQAVEIKNIYTK